MPETANTPKEKLRQLQCKLYVCAKQSRTRRFHALYDRIYRSDVLWEAWKRVISPLLANIYLNKLDRIWAARCSQIGILIRYCDDFVVMCRTPSQAREALRRIGLVMDRLGLTLHPAKTRLVDLRLGKEGFVFLGCTIRKKRSIPRAPPLAFHAAVAESKGDAKASRSRAADHQQATKRERCEASDCGTDARASRLAKLFPDGKCRPGVQQDG